MRRLITFVLILTIGVVFAQTEGAEPDTVITMEPQAIPVESNVITSQVLDISFGVAQEIFVGPTSIEATLREGHQMTSLYISLASKTNTRVRLVLSNPGEVVTNQDLNRVTLFEGSQHAINFVAFSPHSGTITVLNEEGQVLAVVPYTVRYEKEFRHSVSGSVNLNGSFSMSYSLSSRQGWSTSVSGGINSDGDLSGSISGSYSW